MLLNKVFNIGNMTPSGAHRYWRVYSYANGTGIGVATSIAKLELRNLLGTDLIGSGTPIAASGTPADAYDGNASTYWTHTTLGPTWIGYDFGSAVSINSFAITARNDTAFGQAPSLGELQYSDDGSTWTRAWQFHTRTAWTTGSQQVFTNTFDLSATAARYWEMRMFSTYRVTSSFYDFAILESQMRAISGGADLTGSGTPSASSEFSTPTYSADKAFDNNTSTFWSSTSNVNQAGWLRYDFGSDVDIQEITLQARNDAVLHTQYPVGLCLYRSADASIWTPVYAWKTGATSNAGIQTFLRGTP